MYSFCLIICIFLHGGVDIGRVRCSDRGRYRVKARGKVPARDILRTDEGRIERKIETEEGTEGGKEGG
jgi:hypothetical protein